MIRTIDVPDCYLCGAPGNRIYDGLTDLLFNVEGEWCLSECPDPECSLVWLDPRPVDADIGLMYTIYYTHTATVTPRAFSLSRAVRLALMRGTRWTLANTTGLWRQIRQRELMYLGDIKPGRLLEVGCGSGIFLERMRQKGWEVQGIELDAKAAEAVRENFGLNVIVGTIESAGLTKKSFDAIVLSHVIEHVPDPISLLANCRDLLDAGGVLVVTTPNIDSLGHRHFEECWRGLEPPRHLHIFSGRTLSTVADRAGFASVKLFTSAATADSYWVASQEIKRHQICGSITLTDKALFLLRAYRGQYSEYFQLKHDNLLGEEIVMICSD
jgi:SAM-dependent methyltransferase